MAVEESASLPLGEANQSAATVCASKQVLEIKSSFLFWNMSLTRLRSFLNKSSMVQGRSYLRAEISRPRSQPLANSSLGVNMEVNNVVQWAEPKLCCSTADFPRSDRSGVLQIWFSFIPLEIDNRRSSSLYEEFIQTFVTITL